MKKRSFGYISACVAVLLCVLMLFQAPAQAAGNLLNYGRQNDSDETLNASGLFENLFGNSEEPLSAAEREALDALSGVALRFNRMIPNDTQTVDHEYDGSLGVLTVRVRQYDFVAANGKTVSWIPTAVSMDGGEAQALTKAPDGEYICKFSGLWHSDDFQLDVDYMWQVEIPAETADGLLTYCYTVGRDAMERLDRYQAEKQAYDTAADAYAAYLRASADYAAAKQAYETYTSEKRIYDEKKAAYDAYVVAKAAYDARLQAYLEYEKKKEAYEEAERKYYAFEDFRQQYESVYDEYEAYTKELEGALSRLDIMESMFLYDSHGWQFYGGVMGSTVDAVLARRKELIETGLVNPPQLIDTADRATKALRPLLKGYAEVRGAKYATKLELYRAEFAYYSEHYEAIRDNIRLLSDSLYKIYSSSGVRAVMNSNAEAKEKIPHFHQFLAQLHVLTCALDDTVTRSDTWKLPLNQVYTVTDLVEEPLLLPDGNRASPQGVTLPEVEVTLPGDEFPEPVEKPVKDFEDVEDPRKEGAPSVVPNPGAGPKEVKDPGDPPAVVLPPEGNAPVEPSIPAEAKALAAELKAGRLKPRQARGSGQILTLHQTVSCRRSITNRKTVTFYDLDGTKLKEETVEYGDAVTPPDMTRPSDERYHYAFLGWIRVGSDENSERVLTQRVTEDLSLTPLYIKTDRLYEITWQVNGAKQTEYYRWGELPTCPLSTDRPSNTVHYTFTGWSSEPVPVQGDAIYTAQYREEPIRFTVTWIVGERTAQSSFGYGEFPVCPLETDLAPDAYRYVFSGWDQPLREVTQDVTYRAEYRKTVLGTDNDGNACPARHTDTAVILMPDQPAVNFSGASAFAAELGKDLILQWGSFSVTFTPAELERLAQVYCTKLEWHQEAGETEEAVLFRVRYLNSIGKEVTLSQALSVKVRYTSVSGMQAMVYRISGDQRQEIALNRFADGSAEFQVNSGAQMLFQPEYGLKYSDPGENSNLTALPARAPAGATVELKANCTYGYEISSAVLIFADGTEQNIGTSFVMPKGAVSVRLNVTPIIYHVTFVSDGQIVSEQDLFFGDNVCIPADPEKAEDEAYSYTFTGWTPYVTRATGEDRNPVYTASFARTPKQVEDVPEGDPDRFLHVVVPVACTVAGVLITALVLCIVFRRRLKAFLAKSFKRIATCLRQKKADRQADGATREEPANGQTEEISVTEDGSAGQSGEGQASTDPDTEPEQPADEAPEADPVETNGADEDAEVSAERTENDAEPRE